MTKNSDDELWGHPKGLYILFFTELWERFSYYGMRAILVLYMISKLGGKNPGLGWDDGFALSIYGWYTMAVYLAAIPGGVLADRFIGQKKAVLVGGFLLCLGHMVLAIDSVTAFFSGLALIVAGVGSLKPNISTMVGGLYREKDPRRDEGFTLFYIGINVGAFISSILVGYIGETVGWHYGFGLAGIGMLIGQAVYMAGQKHLAHVGNFIGAQKNSVGMTENVALTKIEKDRIKVLLLSFIIVIIFFAAFEQAGGLMNIYTMEKVNRMIFGFEIPASIFQAANPFFIMCFGTVVASYWVHRHKKNKESSSLFKMAIGTMVMGSGFLLMAGAALEVDASSTGQASLYWLIGAYFLHTIGELCCSPVALSFITKLAPARYASIMMGVFFATSGLGNKFAGLIGELASEAGELETFMGIFIFCTLFGGLLILFLKKLKELTHGAESIELVSAEVDLKKSQNSTVNSAALLVDENI